MSNTATCPTWNSEPFAVTSRPSASCVNATPSTDRSNAAIVPGRVTTISLRTDAFVTTNRTSTPGHTSEYVAISPPPEILGASSGRLPSPGAIRTVSPRSPVTSNPAADTRTTIDDDAVSKTPG
ncbi:MAG: hypothetical protein ACK5CE_22860 [Actinomycetes bacterium]